MNTASQFRAKYSAGRLESLGATALARVAEVDLARFRLKLMEKLDWSAELCQQVEDRYRKFLALMLLYPKQGIVPTPLIDEFWHAHILDTVAYHKDCEQLFGSYQHHFPSFPDDPPTEAEALRAGAIATDRLFRLHFGIDPWTDEEIRNFRDDSPELINTAIT